MNFVFDKIISTMHMVKACFPQARHFLKYLSRLNAIRGKYPKSSNNVNKGKNIAMGGSMTEMTHANVRYIPSTKTPFTQSGAPILANKPVIQSWIWKSPWDKSWDKPLAPEMVSQNTPANRRSITGNPVHLPVRIRSIRRSRWS